MLTEIRDNGQSTQYGYDENASLIRETDANGNTVTYEYDNDQNITAISVESADGSKLGETGYSYNGDGSLAAISGGDSQPIAQYEYDGEGNVQVEAAGNGNRTEYEYDISGRPTDVKVTHADGGTAADYDYTYAVDGTLKEEAEQVQGTHASYEYDGMGRLEGETVTGNGQEETTTYSYDASGNRTEARTEEGTIQNEYDGANRLTQAGEDAVSYDGDGNLTQYGGISYEYDARNRLTSVQTPEHTIRYEYDVNGRLISRDVDGSREELVWANGAIVAKTGAETTYYHNDMQAGVKASEDADGVQYYASGKRGDIIETTDGNGETIESMSYDAAGQQEKQPESQEEPEEPREQKEEKSGEEPQEPAGQEGKEPQEEVGQEEPQGFEPGYTGSFYDHEAGLVYLNARFYSPELGCFLSEDTVEGNEEELMTLNRYAYCKQDPVNYTDPSGHWPGNQHQTMTDSALTSTGYGNNAVMKECIFFSVQYADKGAFHYSKSDKDEKTGKKIKDHKLKLSEASKKRASLKNLKGFCDESNVNYKNGTKSNDFGAPYHGRGDYYTYVPYLLGLALQFQKGYQIQNLALRNDNKVYQQMNFDMLIHLSGIYEVEKHTNMTGQKYSYLILGIALHLVEDLWAHVAIINDSKRILEELQKKEKCFKYLGDLEELRYDQGKPICYLNMSPFCKPKTKTVSYYSKTHSELAEGNKDGANERRECARDAAARLLTYFKNGRIMHSGSKRLEGSNRASQADKKRLAVSKCANIILNIDTYTYKRQEIDKKTGKPLYDKKTKKPRYKTHHLKYARYICRAYSNGRKDSCYLLYFNDKRKRGGKQIMLRLGYAAMN